MRIEDTEGGRFRVHYDGVPEVQGAKVAMLMSFLQVTEGEGGSSVRLAWSADTLRVLREAASGMVRVLVAGVADWRAKEAAATTLNLAEKMTSPTPAECAALRLRMQAELERRKRTGKKNATEETFELRAKGTAGDAVRVRVPAKKAQRRK